MTRFLNLALLAVLFMTWVVTLAQEKGKGAADTIPQKVLEGLKARFPQPDIEKWTREEEGGLVIYDFEFTQGGKKFEADIKEDGTLHNWEKAVTVQELPTAVRLSIEKKHPKASMKEIMQITAVIEGRDELEGYEIVLKTEAKKEIEVTIAPDGTILEDSGKGK